MILPTSSSSLSMYTWSSPGRSSRPGRRPQVDLITPVILFQRSASFPHRSIPELRRVFKPQRKGFEVRLLGFPFPAPSYFIVSSSLSCLLPLRSPLPLRSLWRLLEFSSESSLQSAFPGPDRFPCCGDPVGHCRVRTALPLGYSPSFCSSLPAAVSVVWKVRFFWSTLAWESGDGLWPYG